MKQFQVRQGDVMIISVDQIQGEKRILNSYKDRLLVHGEHSNHAHYAIGNCEVMDKEGEIFISASERFELKHLLDSGVWTKEHQDISIPPGTYKVVRQTEYNPYQKAIEYVQD